jgi:hypothetical protein
MINRPVVPVETVVSGLEGPGAARLFEVCRFQGHSKMMLERPANLCRRWNLSVV